MNFKSYQFMTGNPLLECNQSHCLQSKVQVMAFNSKVIEVSKVVCGCMKKALRQAHQQLNDSQVLHVHTIKRLYQGRESEQGLPPALMLCATPDSCTHKCIVVGYYKKMHKLKLYNNRIDNTS